MFHRCYGGLEDSVGVGVADVGELVDGVGEELVAGLVLGEADGEAVGVEVVPGDEEAGDEDGDGE